VRRAATERFSTPWRNKQFSEFANATFAATTNKNRTSRKKDKVMKMKNTVISVIIAVTQSKWMRPALMTLAIVATVLVVTGCPAGHQH
jgi:undecaprenyl pyrophosphate phosphatase UppP